MSLNKTLKKVIIACHEMTKEWVVRANQTLNLEKRRSYLHKASTFLQAAADMSTGIERLHTSLGIDSSGKEEKEDVLYTICCACISQLFHTLHPFTPKEFVYVLLDYYQIFTENLPDSMKIEEKTINLAKNPLLRMNVFTDICAKIITQLPDDRLKEFSKAFRSDYADDLIKGYEIFTYVNSRNNYRKGFKKYSEVTVAEMYGSISEIYINLKIATEDIYERRFAETPLTPESALKISDYERITNSVKKWKEIFRKTFSDEIRACIHETTYPSKKTTLEQQDRLSERMELILNFRNTKHHRMFGP